MDYHNRVKPGSHLTFLHHFSQSLIMDLVNSCGSVHMALITEVPLTKMVRKTYKRSIIILLLHHIGGNITTQLLTQFGIIVTLNARDARYAVFLYIWARDTFK